MRSMILSIVLGATTLGVVASTPADAQAQWWRRGYYSSYYYPGYGYYYPAYSSYYYPGYASYYPGYTGY